MPAMIDNYLVFKNNWHR